MSKSYLNEFLFYLDLGLVNESDIFENEEELSEEEILMATNQFENLNKKISSLIERCRVECNSIYGLDYRVLQESIDSHRETLHEAIELTSDMKTVMGDMKKFDPPTATKMLVFFTRIIKDDFVNEEEKNVMRESLKGMMKRAFSRSKNPTEGNRIYSQFKKVVDGYQRSSKIGKLIDDTLSSAK